MVSSRKVSTSAPHSAGLNIGELHRNLGGLMRVGVGRVLAVSVFPEVLVAFHQQFPSVRVIAEAGISTKLVEGLLREDFDLVLAALPDAPLPERFVATPLFKSDMVVVCRREHPLRSRGLISLDQLLEFERIGFVEDQEFEKKSELEFGARARKMRPALESTSLSIMFGILKATVHYAVVSEMILRRAQREGLEQLPVSESFWQLEIDLMCKLSLSSSRPVRMLKDALLSNWRH
jgi:DNA-binding transcriptional LysR family regulator